MRQFPSNCVPAAAPERLTVALFVLMMALLLADQNLMAPNLSAIGTEFGLLRGEIDKKLGADINLMFWLLGAAVTLGIGYLTDRNDLSRWLPRKRLLVSLVAVGQGACLLSGLAHTYTQLYWARVGTAVGLGAAGPVLFSLLGDMFPPSRRAHALALLNVSCSLGIGAGQLLAGLLGACWGWRAPFLLVGCAGLLLCALYGRWGSEPRRGAYEPGLQALHEAGIAYEERVRWTDTVALLRTRTNLYSLLGSLSASVPYAVLVVFLTDYLAQDRGLTVPQATLVVMAIGGGGVLGNILSGALLQRLVNRAPHRLPIFCGLVTLGLIPLAELFLTCPLRSDSFPHELLLLGLITGSVLTLPSANPMLLSANPPARRGSIMSLSVLCGDLGRGLGAWLVGTLAAHVGRTVAFQLAFAFWLPTGILLLLLAPVFPQEQKSVQEALRRLAWTNAAAS